jgi:hypothetical protein
VTQTIGNIERLAFELVPVSPSFVSRYSPERAAWAGLAIWVGGINLCQHTSYGSPEVENHVFVPLGPLANWLVVRAPYLAFEESASLYPTGREAHDSLRRWADSRRPSGISEERWFDCREAWWRRHFLSSDSEGSFLPNVALLRDDEELVVDWGPSRFAGAEPPQFLHERGEFSLSWESGLETLSEFCGLVAEWFREAGLQEAYGWLDQDDPFRSADLPLLDDLELFTGWSIEGLETVLGVDNPQALLEMLGLSEADRDPAAGPLCQVLRDMDRSGTDVGAVLRGLCETVAVGHERSTSSRAALRATALDGAQAGSTGEEAGYEAATAVRRELGLPWEPIQDLAAVLEPAQVDHRHEGEVNTRDRMLVAAREGGRAQVVTLPTGRTSTPWGRRFEVSRGVGHVLLDGLRDTAIGAASGPRARSKRSRRSGAFAAELLLPGPAMARASNGELDGAASPARFEGVLQQYGVGAQTAAYQLWNRGWLSSPEVRDELIETYAAVSE